MMMMMKFFMFQLLPKDATVNWQPPVPSMQALSIYILFSLGQSRTKCGQTIFHLSASPPVKSTIASMGIPPSIACIFHLWTSLYEMGWHLLPIYQGGFNWQHKFGWLKAWQGLTHLFKLCKFIVVIYIYLIASMYFGVGFFYQRNLSW